MVSNGGHDEKEKRIIISILLLCMLTNTVCRIPGMVAGASSTECFEDVHVWTAHGNYAVMQNPADMEGEEIQKPIELSGDTSIHISVMMGKGETEGTQIIISPEIDVESYDIQTTSLACGEHQISKENVKVYNQYYINAEHPDEQKFRAVPTGWCPDMLVPFDKAKKYGENHIEAGKNQGITIELTTTSDTYAGVYTGQFVLNVNGKSVNVPVSVEVRDIDLSSTHAVGTTAASMGNVNTVTYEMLMNDYRICCQYAPQATSSPQKMVEMVKKYWDNPHFTNYDIPNVDEMTFKAFVKGGYLFPTAPYEWNNLNTKFLK